MDTSDLATKPDIAALAAATKSDIAGVKAELKTDIAGVKAELKADIAHVRVEMREMKAEIFRAMLIQAGTIVGLTVALMKLLP